MVVERKGHGGGREASQLQRLLELPDQGCRGVVSGNAAAAKQHSFSTARYSVEISSDWQVCELILRDRQRSCGGVVPWHACWSGPGVLMFRHGSGMVQESSCNSTMGESQLWRTIAWPYCASK